MQIPIPMQSHFIEKDLSFALPEGSIIEFKIKKKSQLNSGIDIPVIRNLQPALAILYS